MLVSLLPGVSGCVLENRTFNSVLDTLGVGGAYPLSESAGQELQRFDAVYARYISHADDKQLRHFSDTFRRVRVNYVEPLEDKALIDAAIAGVEALEGDLASFEPRDVVEAGLDGMMASLDPHSSYMNPREFTESQVSTRGQFGGLGIEIIQENDTVKVVSPIEDTPAFAAGLQAGDLITHVNGEDIRGKGISYAVNLLRGDPGTAVTITIERADVTSFNVNIVRAIIKVRSVKWRLEGDIGYIRVTRFTERVESGIVNAMNDIRSQLGVRLAGIVLDLRNNPGGLLDQSLILSDAFLEDGRIVSIRYREGDGMDRHHSASPGDMAAGLPMAVLINGGSASASEIVAGALQDHGRATILGERSFGKGSVQTISPLPVEGALRLTIARYYAPSGRVIQARGITPDIVLLHDPEEGEFTREVDLPHSLGNSQEMQDRDVPAIASKSCDGDAENEDPDLVCALMFLHSESSAEFLSSVGIPPQS
ncbi:MAG: S41 family peptidase [Rhodospirillales bacterium]|nr:S41 family peptidase [Rhodospirillales bacterium]MBT4625311.1 S41 family peptidase [Rhodospirillales bacterium]MBT5353259.1 S41 family peptidase [Rhodospirillales bacterium]MBT5520243.1 S41 family peptidase [Rhodospirillales bacterium]MBT6109266.1 S41 family peptidase [Rhodospirillales bacterium]